MKTDTKVSIIIPCYNQGQFIDAAVDSVLAQSYQHFEVVIVNDGSTDDKTNRLLKNYDRAKTRVIHTENHGLAAARNRGVQSALGEYVLPLDADDCIGPLYLEKAVCLLDAQDDLGIVYCRAQLFGAVETEWLLPQYSLKEMLLDNVIFCSAMFRKSDWQAVGGYDPGMIYGWEDYDFWLSLIELGRKVYQIPEILFSYRVASDSMVRSKERWQKVAMFKRIFERHSQLFSNNIEVWINSLMDVREHYFTSKLYIDTGNGISDADCLSRKVESGTFQIQFTLEENKNIQAIRFDPVDVPAVIEIFEVTVINQQGERSELSDITDNACFQVGEYSYFETNDPQYFLHLSESQLQDISSISVRLSFKALAAEALQQIVKIQQEEIEALSAQLRTYESVGPLKAMGLAIRKQDGEGGKQYLKRQLKPF